MIYVCMHAALHAGLSTRVARLGALTSLAASSRDVCVVLENIALRTHPEVKTAMPILASPHQRRTALTIPSASAAAEASAGSGQGAAAAAPAAGASAAAAHDALGSVLPLRDVSLLDDSRAVDGSPAPSGVRLDAEYMDKISCWPALQPSHMESSYSLLSAVKLFPPQVRRNNTARRGTARGVCT